MNQNTTTTSFENLQLQFHQIPAIQQITLQPIQSNYKKVMIYTWIIIYSILFATLIVLCFLVDDFIKNLPLVYGSFGAFFAIVLFTFFYINIEFKNRSFAIRQHDILYKSGWIFQKIQALPYAKIQHCTLSQNVIAKKFNLANITFYTAAGHGGDVTIHGLIFEEADQLKDFITQQNKQLHEPNQS